MAYRLGIRSVSLPFISYRVIGLVQRFSVDSVLGGAGKDRIWDGGSRAQRLSGKEKMGGRSDASESTISSMIERHRRARSYRSALEQRVEDGRSRLFYPTLIFVRWRERRALSRLIAVVPSNAEGARRKLVYLMATMIADQAPEKLQDVETVVSTLRPYQDSLTHRLRK